MAIDKKVTNIMLKHIHRMNRSRNGYYVFARNKRKRNIFYKNKINQNGNL